MKTYTSDQILELGDLYELQDTFASSGIPFRYRLTWDEHIWALELKGKYVISDWVLSNLDEEGFVTFNCPFELSRALSEDGMAPLAVMLSDDSALQRLFFWLCNE